MFLLNYRYKYKHKSTIKKLFQIKYEDGNQYMYRVRTKEVTNSCLKCYDGCY